MKKRFPLALCLALCLGSAATSAPALKHVLQKGETLYSLSRQYKVPYEALAAANGITDPTKLKLGTVLLIPSVHIVAKGETLYGIARQAGIPVAELLAANKLGKDYVLKVGDVLVVPASTEEATTVPTSPTPAPATTSTAQNNPPPTTGGTTTSAPKPQASIPPPAQPATSQPASSTSVQSATTTTSAPVASSVSAQPQGQAKPGTTLPLPEPVKTQDRTVDPGLRWPASGKAMYLEGKLEGVMIRVKPGETAKAVAAGTVVSAGPSRGFSQVVFVQAKSGYVYVYGGIDSLGVKTGDQLASGAEIGKIGIDPKDGGPIAYFFVFRNGQPIDPAAAPRD